MSQSDPVDFAAFKAVRDEIAHEDSLMGTRLNWFFASQAFLLTAMAIANRSGGPVPPGPRNNFYFPLIPLLAIASCVLIALGIIGGAVALRRWRRLLNQMIRQDPTLPAIGRDAGIMWLGWSAPLLLPVAFLIAWTYLLMVGWTA